MAEVGQVEAETDLVERTAAEALTGYQQAIAKRQQAAFEVMPTAESLIARAIDRGVPVESLERLLAMRERLKAEAAREAFFEALSAFQADCPVIEKGKTAKIDTKSGSQYSYKYAPLEDIMRAITPSLRRYGLSIRFDAEFKDNPPAQVVACIVTHRDGHAERSDFRSPVDTGARMSVMQQAASSLTYGRRYALLNALGIVVGGEDDDGAGASGRGSGAGTRPPAVVDTRVAAPPVASTSSGGKAEESPTPRPLGKHVVRIPRPSQEPQGSDGTPPERSLVSIGSDTVAATPAAPEDDAAKAQLRQSIIEAQMKLLRLRSRYADMPESDLWEKATDVSNAMCQMHYQKPLHEMTRWDLERANARMEQAMAEQLGATA